jgi:hypothetical protein
MIGTRKGEGGDSTSIADQERSLNGLQQDKRGIKHPSGGVDLQGVSGLEHPVKVF